MVLHPTSGTDTTVAAGQHDAVTVHLLAGDDHLSLTIGDLGAYDGALTIDGGADTDTLTVTSDENMTLSAGQLLVGSRSITLTDVENVNLQGGAGDNTFTITDFTGPASLDGQGGSDTADVTRDASFSIGSGAIHAGTQTITLASIEHRVVHGGAGDNTFSFTDNFGDATVTTGGGSDTLDFTGLTASEPVTHPTDTTFGDATGDTLTISNPKPDHIDFTLVSASSLVTKVDQILDKVAAVVSAVDTAGNALSSVLPLLDPSIAGSVDKIVKLVDSFNAMKTKIDTALASLPAVQLSDIVSALNTALSSTDIPFPLRGLHFATAYESLAGDFLAYITATLTAGNPLSCSTGTGCLSTQVPLDFGDKLDAIGIALDSDPATPGAQPPVFTARGAIGIDLALGVDITTPGDPFLKSNGHIDLAFNASITTINATVTLGVLQASISSGSITIAGTATLALHDTGAADGIDPLGELGPDAVDVTAAGTISSPITLTATIAAGVQIGTSDLNLASAQLAICFGADCTPNPSVQLFGPGGETPAVNVTFHTNADGGHDLLNSLSNATSFSNLGPTEIISMLSQVASFFSSMAGQSFLGSAQIPFTSITLGQALDYAKEFTHNVIDPLFKSGDSTKPDANGDGRVDVSDFNFSSVQNLLDRLEAALGLTPGFLKATYDPAAGTLEFNFSLDRTLGIGTDVAVAPAGAVVLDSAKSQGGAKFTIGAGSDSAHYKITYVVNNNSTGDLAWNADLAAVQSAIAAITGIPTGVHLTCQNTAGSCTGGPFVYSFDSDGTIGTLVPNETQYLLLAASGGTFSISTATKAVTGIAWNVSLATFQANLDSLIGAGLATVRCASGGGTCSGGSFQIVYNLGTAAGTDVPLFAVDGTALANDHNLKQILLVPATTGDFWLTYADGTVIQLTDKIGAGITAGGLAGKLAALSAIHVGSVARIDGDTTAYLITLTGTTDVKTIGGAGGFSLDFGATLGGLASLTTTGSVIPLAELIANITFGINLNPSSAISVGPEQFTAGPRVDVTTAHDGGKTIAIRTIRPGVLGSAGTVLVLTVNGGGTFTLAHSATTSSPLSPGLATSALETAIAGILGVSAGNVHVTRAARPEGWVYTITFDDVVDPTLAQAITVSGTGLTAIDEVQHVDVVNATGGTFVLTYGGQGTAPLSSGASTGTVKSALTALSSIGSGGVSVAGSANHYVVTFSGGTLHNTNTGDITPDASQLTGALTSGTLATSANFTVSITNGSAVITSIGQDAVATATQATIADGGTGLGVTTTTPGSGTANEVQTLTVRASGGTFTLAFGVTTSGPVAFDVSADTLKGVLEGIGIGSGNVAVTQSSSIAGTLYTITFQGAKAHTDVAQLIATGSLTARNETQQITIAGAASGHYKLFFDANNNGLVDTGEITGDIAVGASAGDVQSALNLLAGVAVTVTSTTAGVYSIVFSGAPLAGTNVRPLSIREAALEAQHEIQHVSLLNATGGTFTLTLGGQTTAPLAWNATQDQVRDAINALTSLPTGVTSSVVLTSGDYAITFSGGSGANQHIDKLVGDSGALENANPTATFSISGFPASHTSAAQLVTALQSALDAAAIVGGITPGLLSVTITHAPVTAGQAVFGHYSGASPTDQPFELHIAISGVSSGTFTMPATSGTFTLTFDDGSTSVTTTPLAVGSGGAVLKSAIEGLSNFHGTASVTLTGSQYTIAFSGGPSLSGLSAEIVVAGNVSHADAASADAFKAALQAAIRTALENAGLVSKAPTDAPVSVTLDTGKLVLSTRSDVAFSITLKFPSPVTAELGGNRISLNASQVQYTFDDHKAPVTLQRHVDVGVDWTDSAFQELGLASSPVRLDYTGHPLSQEVQFTLLVNDAEIPVDIQSSAFSGVTSIDGLITVLQAQIDAALLAAFNGNALAHDDGNGHTYTIDNYKLLVCRPNINPAGEKCDHVGNRIEFQVVTESSAITTLAMNVPAFLDDGTTRNGAVTELGFEAVAGATHRGRAGTFYLDDVTLAAHVRVALQDVSATAALGFLAVKATAAGTINPGSWLLSLDGTLALKNPLSNSGPDANRIDLAVLGAALRNGHFLWDSSATNGTPDSPNTGFFSGTLAGGFGADLTMKPDGFLDGLGDLNAHLTISLQSSDWFTSFPTPDVHWTGPDFDSVLQRFKNLDAASIAQALQLIVNFVKELAHPTASNAISDVLNAQLPLINKSLSQLLDIASDIADQIHEAITNPSGAIQMLNNVLANAFGMPTPRIPSPRAITATAARRRRPAAHRRGQRLVPADVPAEPRASGHDRLDRLRPTATAAANATCNPDRVEQAGRRRRHGDSVERRLPRHLQQQRCPAALRRRRHQARQDRPPALPRRRDHLLVRSRREHPDRAAVQSRPDRRPRLAAVAVEHHRQLADRRGRRRQPHGQRRREAPHLARPRPEPARDVRVGRHVAEAERDGRHVQGDLPGPHDERARLRHLCRGPRDGAQGARRPLRGHRHRRRRRLHDRLPRRGDHRRRSHGRRHLADRDDEELLPQDRLGRRCHASRPDGERRRHEPELQRAPRPVRPLRQGRLASLGGTIRLSFVDGPHTGQQARFNLVGFGGRLGSFTSDLGSIGDFIGAGSVCVNPHGWLVRPGVPIAQANLPLYVGTAELPDPDQRPAPRDAARVLQPGDRLGRHQRHEPDRAAPADVFEFHFDDGNPTTPTEMPWANF